MFIIQETFIHLTKTSYVWGLSVITRDSFCSFWKAVSKSLIFLCLLRTHSSCFNQSVFIRQWCFVRNIFLFVTCFIPFCLMTCTVNCVWEKELMTKSLTLVSKEFYLQWIGIDVSLNRCVRLLCDLYFNEFGFIFISSYQTCFSVSHAAITMYVLQDLWTTTMYHVYKDQINAMVVTTICCFVYVMIENESESREYKYMYFCCHEVIRWMLWFVYIHVL